MSNGINSLNIPTINGLQNLTLDNLDVGTIDGDLFYIDRIEASEIILDKKITMNNNTWINTNGTTITNIELSYLDNCNSNIQTQINNVNTGNTNLQTQINTHTSQITALQTSDTSQNSTLSTHTTQIYNLNYAVTGQITSITNLQTSDTSQNTRLTNIETLNTTQDTRLTNLDGTLTTIVNNISTLQSKTQNIYSANSTNTIMNKPLQIDNNGESIKMNGTNTNIAGYDSTTGTRDFAIGNASSANKKINFIVDKQDSLNFISGTNASNYKGRNNLNTYSNGITMYRGWSDSGNTLEYSGAIGQLNPSLPHFFIAGNSTNPIYIDAGLSSITLNTNTVWMSGATVAGNGRYSNLNMLNSAGTAWETQSSAFTETIKAQITTNQTNITTLQTNVTALQNTLNNSKTAIARINYSNGNVFLLGRTTTLTANTNYSTLTFVLKVGPLLNTGGYSAFFNSNGNWIYNASQRVNFQFDMEFNGLDTGIKAMVSRFLVTSSGGSALLQSSYQGVRYNSGTGNPLYTTLYYSTGNFVFDISYGDIVSIETENWFSTSSLGASVTTTGRLTFYLSQF